jgi:hypothetical protein
LIKHPPKLLLLNVAILARQHLATKKKQLRGGTEEPKEKLGGILNERLEEGD